MVSVVLSGSLSILSSVIDSAVDLLSGIVLWATSYTMKKRDLYKYPGGMIPSFQLGKCNCLFFFFCLSELQTERGDFESIQVFLCGCSFAQISKLLWNHKKYQKEHRNSVEAGPFCVFWHVFSFLLCRKASNGAVSDLGVICDNEQRIWNGDHTFSRNNTGIPQKHCISVNTASNGHFVILHHSNDEFYVVRIFRSGLCYKRRRGAQRWSGNHHHHCFHDR